MIRPPVPKNSKKKKKRRQITVENSKIFVNEALIGELRAHGGDQVNIPVNENQVLDLRSNGGLL